MQYTDEEILEAVNTKDKVLYRRLYDCYYASLCRYAAKLLRDVASEEDVVQDVLLRFWETEVTFKDVSALTIYFFRAVYNGCLNIFRDRKKMIVSMGAEDLPENFNDFDNERILVEEEYFRQIYLAIDTLSGQRKQVILKALEGKSREEIALELNVSVNTVKTLKRKAYNELREKLSTPLFLVFLLLLK